VTKVLVIDDEEPIRLLCRVNLQLENMDVLEAADGPSGLDQAREHRPDVILLDVMMPGTDGWEMLRQVQERHGIGAIPVIMFSGKVDEQALAEATARGARGFIGKPFDLQQLIDQTKQLVPVT
jgi:CheY-like chemotaxis protein